MEFKTQKLIFFLTFPFSLSLIPHTRLPSLSPDLLPQAAQSRRAPPSDVTDYVTSFSSRRRGNPTVEVPFAPPSAARDQPEMDLDARVSPRSAAVGHSYATAPAAAASSFADDPSSSSFPPAEAPALPSLFTDLLVCDLCVDFVI